MNAQLEKTPCRIPFSAALEASAWREFLQRFSHQQSCDGCQREFTQDTNTGRWYPSEEVEFGAEPWRSDEVHPVVTQQGWFHSEDCHMDKFPEVA